MPSPFGAWERVRLLPKALLDYLGYAIYFWINEGTPLEPVHVHVAKGKPAQNATKIWMTREGIRMEHNNSNIPPKDLKALLDFIGENQSTIIRVWLNRFGEAKLKQ